MAVHGAHLDPALQWVPTLLNRPLAAAAPSSERLLLVMAKPASLNRGAIWSLKDTSTSSMVMVPGGCDSEESA